ncbi:MAG: hypothetical protein J6Q77_01590, partial [Clostridia bacterium]|nr:hypothetical protein [Clostridia bacterium]
DFDSSFLDIKCDVDDYEESEEEDEDNGIYIETMRAKCPDCGLEIYAKYVESYKNCIEKYTLEYEFKMNGEVILHFVMEEEEEYHDDSRQTVDLTEHGCCGGTVSLYICNECGLVTNYSGSNFGCNGTTKTEEIVDENGNIHEISIYECADCGLKQIMEVWEEKISDCEIIYHGILKITVGDKVIADIEISESDEEHEYEAEFEFFGEEGHCEGGYKVKYSCSVCGDSYETVRVGHRFWVYEEIPFDDAITCGGSIYASTCEICGTIGHVEDLDIVCDLSKTETSTVTDENGVEHMIASAECSKCGAKFECDMWVEMISVCESNTHMEYTIKDSEGNILHEFDITEGESDHEYEYEYQLHGETCDDGYTVTEHCDKCGDESTWSSSGHRVENEQIDMGEIGGCGGFINVDMCDICGDVTYFYYNSYCNIYNDSQKTEEIVGEDGLVHYIVTSTCPNCSLTYIEESWQTEKVDCSCIRYGRLCIIKGEEVIFDLTRSENYAEHDYERSYKLHGVSCDDGYDIIDRCKSCGHTENWKSSGHRGDYKEINLGDYLPCGGWADISYCEICNETTHFNENTKCHWMHEGLTDDGYDKEVCERCGAVKLTKHSRSELGENCTVVVSYEYKYFLNDELVLEIIVSEKEEHHNFEYSFELYGESCEDGVRINTHCLDCGTEYSGFSYWHSLYDKEEIELSEHGACGGAIHVRECPCGEYKEINIDHDCRMETLSEDKTDSGYSYVSRCAECGLTITRENGSEKVGCYVQWYESVTVVIGDKAIFGPEIYITGKEDRHNYEYTYFLQGESCKDGVITVATCKDCGESYETESYWCNDMLVAEYRFDEHGACAYGCISVYSCPCGAQSYVNFDCGCAYESEWDNYVDGNGVAHEVETLFCRSCGLQIVRDVYGEKNGCEVLYYTTYTVTIGDKTVVDGLMTQTGRNYNHNYETSFEMYGESCEDGVVVHRVCSDCGEEYTHDIFYHETFLVEGYDFNDYGACGKDGYLYIYSCACGEKGSVEYSDGCVRYMGEETVIDGNGVTHNVATYSCPKCGLHITVDSYDEKDGCYRYKYNTYTVKVGDTVIVDKLQCLYSLYDEHDYEQEVKLMGESCEDGVFVNSTCKTCGYTTSEEYFWHKEIDHAQISFEGNGCCDARIEIYGCACGYNGYANINFNGKQRRSTYEDENGVQHILYTYSCNSCGIVITRDVYTLADGCYTVSYSTYRMTMNGELILDDVRLIGDRSENHNYEYSFNMYGESCYDGYDAIRTCRDCGETYMSSYSWHEIFHISTYEFSEYGACGGSIAIFACPCGYECTLKYDGESCQFSDGKEETYFDENGVEHRVNSMTCDICGLTIVSDMYSVKENCQVKSYNIYTVYIGDTVIVDNITSLYSTYEQHNYDREVQMMGESCEDGVYVHYFCIDCGYGYEDTYWDHWTYEKELVELSEHGACEGKIVVSECLCGDICDINISFCFDMYNENQYVDENGIKHNVTVYTCKSCGLRVQYDSYTLRDPGKCIAVTYTSIAVSVGDKAIGVYESIYKQSESHDLLYSAELVDGAEQCGQGVIVTQYCRDCDYRYTDTYYYHYEIDLNKIDLSELGSTCGGYAVERGCACGKYHNLDLHGESNCLFEERYVGSIEGLEESSSVYIYTCAVTDPACGFKVKRQNYYMAEPGSCVEYYYYTWLFGYNEETGEYKYELTYKREDEYRTHHSYVNSEIETVEDGFTVKGSKNVCSVCGSYEENKNYYSNGKRVKYTIVAEYFHEKADTVYQNEIYEYTYYTNSNGKQDYYISREYYYYTYSSGRISWREVLCEEDHNYVAPFGEKAVYSKRTYRSSDENFIQEVAYTYYKDYEFVLFEYTINEPGTEKESWYRCDYTYDFTNGCLRTYVYTNSNGERNEEISEYHRSYKHSYEGGSCTQDNICTRTCVICGHIIDSYPESPYNHDWYYNYNTGIYECGRCGLEHANGASGSIVMEDMSEKYGEGVNYVVGYWNVDYVKYTYYVSLVLRGVDGDEIFLEVECTEAEDIRAYFISKEAVAKFAAEMGLTAEDYDVKFTFVPEGADGSYDYAIVFTSETAAKK